MQSLSSYWWVLKLYLKERKEKEKKKEKLVSALTKTVSLRYNVVFAHPISIFIRSYGEVYHPKIDSFKLTLIPAEQSATQKDLDRNMNKYTSSGHIWNIILKNFILSSSYKQQQQQHDFEQKTFIFCHFLCKTSKTVFLSS